MELIGKLHPLLLHLPIGVLIYTVLHWVYARVALPEDRQPDFTFSLGLGSLSAILSAVSGWMLANEGGYDEQLLDWHKYLGIATAVGSVGLFWAYRRVESTNTFGIILFGFMGLLTVTGHYGGSLTHGVDFLSASAKTPPAQIEDINEAHVFNDLVMPIIEDKCVSCHNPQKSKGDLLLHQLDGWLEGGKHGAVVKAGLSIESSLINRIFLPKEDEEHMPPTGKLQLTNDERLFLKWWVDSMATYDHLVKDLTQPKEIEAYLKQVESTRGIDVDRPSQAQLDKLLGYGIVAELQAKDTPWVEVFLANAATFDPSGLRKLDDIAPMIRAINLSNSRVRDNDLKTLSECENLEEVNLSNCKISSQGLEALFDLKRLKVLNLYGSDVDKSIFDGLQRMPSLEKVYAWNTKIASEAIEALNDSDPNFKIEVGADVDLFGESKLVAPFIVADQDLFKDSLLVSIETKAQRASILYSLNSLDAFTPYASPFYIATTTEVRAKLIMDGWQDSDLVSKTFAKSRHKIESIQASVEANEKYPADGPSTLIDLQKGSSSFGDGKWLGYFGDDVTFVVDLGKTQEISGVTVGALSDFRSYIHQPKSITVQVSQDSKTYLDFAELSALPIPVLAEANVQNHYLTALSTRARYVKIALKNQQVNPESHPAPGATCWLFIDEILID